MEDCKNSAAQETGQGGLHYTKELVDTLLRNHLGARKQRSTTQELTYFQEQVYDTWRGNATVSLISFDVKGAYSNVAKEPELERLRNRQIPDQMVRWVDDFCKQEGMHRGHRSYIESTKPAAVGPPTRVPAISDPLSLL